jgi:amidase
VVLIGHRGCAYLSAIAVATILYNIVDSPVGIIPVTRVDPNTDQLPADFKPGVSGRSKLFEERMYMGKNPVYDPTAMRDMPVGIQVVGKKWEDEKVLAMMHVVDKALGPRGFGPGSWKRKETK